jgi:hypothetical protein
VPWRSSRRSRARGGGGVAGGYVVRDGNGQALAYVYCRANEAEAMQAKVLTEDEAREGSRSTSRGCRTS